MAAALQIPNFLVGHVGNQRLQLQRIEEMIADIGTVLGFVCLIIAVVDLHHPLAQHAIDIAGKELVPLAVPHDFNNIPAGATELAFQLLHNLAAAANRAVEALQVAVDDEHQIVQMLARGEADLPTGFRLVHLAVAKERPNLASGVLDQATAFQITHEARLIERHHRAETHRNRRELPKMRHQPRVRIRRQPVAAHFLTVIVELLLGEAAFKEGAGVHPRRAVPLEEDQIAALLAVLTVPEVVLPDLVHHRRGCKTGDVTADIGVLAGTDNHRQRIPAHISLNAFLQLQIAGIRRLALHRDSVVIRRGEAAFKAETVARGLVEQRFQNEMRAFLAFLAQHAGKRCQPFAGFLRVNIFVHLLVASKKFKINHAQRGAEAARIVARPPFPRTGGEKERQKNRLITSSYLITPRNNKR